MDALIGNEAPFYAISVQVYAIYTINQKFGVSEVLGF